jgi:aryl-alcohol dehydrogenase-like predicted oxidoreductase
MVLNLSPEVEAKLLERSKEAGMSPEQYVERLVGLEHLYTVDEDEMSDEELEDLRAAVDEGLDAADRGETYPAEEVFARFRTRHGLSDIVHS